MAGRGEMSSLPGGQSWDGHEWKVSEASLVAGRLLASARTAPSPFPGASAVPQASVSRSVKAGVAGTHSAPRGSSSWTHLISLHFQAGSGRDWAWGGGVLCDQRPWVDSGLAAATAAECDQSPAGRAGAGELQRVSGASGPPRDLPQATWRRPAPTCLAYSFTLSSSNIHRGALRGSTWIKPEDNNTSRKVCFCLPRPLVRRTQPVSP